MEKEINQTKRLGALLLLAGLGLAGAAGGCLHLNQQLHNGLLREEALTAQIHQLEEQLAQQQTTLDQVQEEAAFLREYSFVTPEGEAPAYTQLYPDFYAQPWTGEEITGGRVACLTFDDGPSANTDRVLKVLEEQGIQATFFVVGKTSPEAQERMRAIVAAGHTLAMHSWSHDYKKLYTSVEAFLEDFYQLYQWIYEVTGQYPQVFRFPGGSINAHSRGIYQELVAEMTRRGFVYFDWNASAQDATPKPLSPAVITENCLKGIGRDLVVILSHDSAARSTTVDALPSIIQGYREAGYTFAPLTPGVKPVILDYKRES